MMAAPTLQNKVNATDIGDYARSFPATAVAHSSIVAQLCIWHQWELPGRSTACNLFCPIVAQQNFFAIVYLPRSAATQSFVTSRRKLIRITGQLLSNTHPLRNSRTQISGAIFSMSPQRNLRAAAPDTDVRHFCDVHM